MWVVLTKSGLRKQVKIGYSWTMLFFGLLVPLFRGDLKWTIVMILLMILVGPMTLGIGVVFIVLIFSFIYNKLYIVDLIEKGWQPDNQTSIDILQNRGIL